MSTQILGKEIIPLPVLEPGEGKATLDNGVLRLTLDAQGHLHELIRLHDRHNYAAGRLCCALFFEQGIHTQRQFDLSASSGDLGCEDDVLVLDFRRLKHKGRNLPVRLKLSFRLEDDEVHASAELVNHSDDLLLKELQFPLVDGMTPLPGHALITTECGGRRFPDPCVYVRQRYAASNQPYSNEDYDGTPVFNVYPGLQAAANCFQIAGPEAGLYFGSHDSSFRNTLHRFTLADGKLGAGFSKHLFLQPGESLTIDGYVVSLHLGSWHVGADKYRTWAETWYRPLPKPDWLKQFTGWHRLIFKQQNGEILFNYDDMPRILVEGKKAGVPGLFLFGWWPGGFDRMYPEYWPDPEMGGRDALVANIRAYQEAGGHVILYASGRLVDRNSQFFKEEGHKYCIKTRSGAEARDAYLFANQSSYERLYGAVELSPMCPDCEGWMRVLKDVIDQAVEYGCDAVFFDQLGTQEYPCYDESHGHPVPYVMQNEGKRRAVAELRDYCRQRNPQMAIGVEIFADCIGESFDFVHGLYLQSNIAANPDYQQTGQRPQVSFFIDWTRYVFPDVIISDRDIRDGNDVERRVNDALLRGLVHDVEIYRCRRTIDAVPHYQEHLAKVTALRLRHAELLMEGSYRDTLGFAIEGDADARAFVRDERMAIVVTQSHLASVEAIVTAPGWTFENHDAVGEANVVSQPDGTLRLQCPRHNLIVLLFHRA